MQMSQRAPPQVMYPQPSLVPYGQHPQPPFYTHQPAAIQSRSPSNNIGQGKTITNVKYGSRKNDQCYRCGTYGHWAKQCHTRQYSQPQGGTPQYEYNTYPPPHQVAKRSLENGNNPLQLQFSEKQDGMVQSDLCSVMTCGSNEKGYEWDEKNVL